MTGNDEFDKDFLTLSDQEEQAQAVQKLEVLAQSAEDGGNGKAMRMQRLEHGDAEAPDPPGQSGAPEIGFGPGQSEEIHITDDTPEGGSVTELDALPRDALTAISIAEEDKGGEQAGVPRSDLPEDQQVPRPTPRPQPVQLIAPPEQLDTLQKPALGDALQNSIELTARDQEAFAKNVIAEQEKRDQQEHGYSPDFVQRHLDDALEWTIEEYGPYIGAIPGYPETVPSVRHLMALILELLAALEGCNADKAALAEIMQTSTAASDD